MPIQIERIIAWLRTVPGNQKVIMYSFFKGSLDLMEGALTYDLGMGCARFDGDVVPETRNAELDRFKNDPSCRVLLATVQSGGTGLNIVEANNVCFMDRWFNPTVHAQAQDRYECPLNRAVLCIVCISPILPDHLFRSRCHRIGQKANAVNVYFADVATTVDEVRVL